MKKVTLLFFTSAFTSVMFAQQIKESEVPEAVKSAMKKKYSNVKVTKWEKEDGYFEAGFTKDKVKNSVLLDAKGNIKESEFEIAVSNLPKGVAENVKKNHPKATIIGAAKITDSKGVITYEAEIKGKDLFFDENGKFFK